MQEARFYEELKEGKVQCHLCPRECVIEEEELGNCKARKNVSGKLYSAVYGKAIASHTDPIEKKPLYHFLPSKLAYSIGTTGCNLHCKHCQNWQISQCKPSPFAKDLSPKQIVSKAKESGSKIIAYTYTEPTVFYEYMLDTAKLAKKEGLKNVMVSNGFINQEPLKELSQYMDGANIDLKAIKDDFYREECKAWVEPVLDSLKTLKREGVWLEVTDLLIPDLNDSKKDIRELVEWMRNNLGEDVPLHLTAFRPCYQKTDVPPTSPQKVKEARDMAKDQGLNYVYSGNIPGWETNSTYCPNCGKVVIKRAGFKILENNLTEGKCKFCEEEIAGIWS